MQINKVEIGGDMNSPTDRSRAICGRVRTKMAIGATNGGCAAQGALIYHDLYSCEHLCMMVDIAKVLGRSEEITYYTSLGADLNSPFLCKSPKRREK